MRGNDVSTQDEKFMQSALKLAAKGIGSVEPNPAVGAVIVKAGQLVGKGYHKAFGGPHAEVNAIDDCRKLGVKPDGATMYITLEPCSHQGKTGPCTDAIIDARLARVVVATRDPSAHANGKGIERLQQAGIEVEVGLCEAEARQLNAPFLKYASTGKCWVVLKWAQSLDGKMAYAEQAPERRWISNELSRKDAHKLRRRVGAIVVGINTIMRDDPMLTPRPAKGRKPIRVVLDNSLRIPLKSRLLRTPKASPILIYTREASAGVNPKHAERIAKRGAEVLAYGETNGASNLPFLLDELGRRGVQQVLVEGGVQVLTSFLKAGLADEVCVYVASKILGAQGAVYMGEPMAALVEEIGLRHVEIKVFDDDLRLTGRLVD
ncbi:MAG: bifunctional diaminohydroxyphosphoribosylaminopyrimidine deaminase/5-amino-6-(5-phosphoribosylamino)uracil reductase RibD [Sedimentisphaerales bacterium]|nr:bifunctional diaminohydroxyphosphoribosylaminopyrimidine deaminase/5-amino-6-(5-phosphoribosylamino)uracil reductase RibD [Sedimentisphaerales bacterium]